MKNLFCALSVFLCVFSASPAMADFSLSEVILDFLDGTPRQHDVEIVSHDASNEQYISVEPYEIMHPGAKNEQRIPIKSPQESGLLITPNKLILPANSRKLIRFLLLQPQGDTDKVYRVVVKPVIRGVDAKQDSIALKILVGYEVLVIVRPKDAKVELSGERKGNQLTITNKGNTNASIKTAKQCDATGGNCKDLAAARIYANDSWTTTLPYMSGPAEFTFSDGKNNIPLTF